MLHISCLKEHPDIKRALAKNADIRVEITFDERAQKIASKTLYHDSDVITPDGQ